MPVLLMSEWLLFNAIWAIVHLIHGKNMLNDDEVRFVLDQHVLTHWNNIPQEDISLHLDTLSWFRANQFLLFLLK